MGVGSEVWDMRGVRCGGVRCGGVRYVGCGV